MKAVIQRVSSASVEVEGKTVGEIERGFLVLLGVKRGDTTEDAAYLARKIAKLRVFNDEAGKMNLSLEQVNGAVLAVSQFTLYADTRDGQPSRIFTSRSARRRKPFVQNLLRTSPKRKSRGANRNFSNRNESKLGQ
jgi:D-tyrosyl-tRNA(Tyr) deacylase